MKQSNEEWLKALVENYKMPEEEPKNKKKILTEEQLKIVQKSKD